MSSVGCSHCGGKKHTEETCFRKHGYPDWWNDYQAKKKKDDTRNIGRAALATSEHQLSMLPHQELPIDTLNSSGTGCIYYTSSVNQCSGWIIDSEATDHMTFSTSNFSLSTHPHRTQIINANGVSYSVNGVDSLPLS